MVMINISLMYKGLLKDIFCDLKGLSNVLNFKLLVQFFVDNNRNFVQNNFNIST